MVSFWRTSLATTLSFSLFLTSIPLHAAKAVSAGDQWEEVKEVMELSVPTRKDETFAETYYRLETRLADSQKREIAELNKKLEYKIAKVKMPTAKVTEDAILLKDGAEEITIKVQKNATGELSIVVNGKTLTQKQAQSPLLTYEFLQKISPTKDKKISGWLWHQFIPESHAFSWPLILGATVVIGGLGYLAYKKFFKKEETCKDKSAVCCNQNGTLVQLDNGCCTEEGGIATLYKTCPAPMYIEDTSGPSGSGVQ